LRIPDFESSASASSATPAKGVIRLIKKENKEHKKIFSIYKFLFSWHERVPMKKIILTLSLMTTALFFMTGCNTISGIGKDVSSLGRGVASGAKAAE
jgi:predicted small secreted protein